MLFNTYSFILFFLPLAVASYFSTMLWRDWLGKWVLLGLSLTFYAWWKVSYLPLLIGSVLVNFGVGKLVGPRSQLRGRPKTCFVVFLAGLAFDLGLLGLYKYADFFLANVSLVTGIPIAPLGLALPLGISFFTFIQLAYITDAYLQPTEPVSVMDYSVFVIFFPHLIAGPIVHHADIMPQFAEPANRRLVWDNLAAGIFLFVLGLCKKVLLADTFATWADRGFARAEGLSFLAAWIAALSFTFQLYFDFSGYSDMAIGVARMFNIRYPYNFNSPYRAKNIQDFWQRWHMTLGRFIREYVFMPLMFSSAAARFGARTRTVLGLIVTFLLVGLWHGAGWTFVVWGGLHGLALAGQQLWSALAPLRLPVLMSSGLTFLFVAASWVVFRAGSLADAASLLKGMCGGNGIVMPSRVLRSLPFLETFGFLQGDWRAGVTQQGLTTMLFLTGGFILVWMFPNSNELFERFQPGWGVLLAMVAGLLACLISISGPSPFLYAQF